MSYQIKGLSHVHHTAIHLAAVVKKIVYSFYNSPSAHSRRTTRLISKLQLIQAQNITKENKNDTIKKFQHEAADCDAPVVPTGIDASKLIFYDGN